MEKNNQMNGIIRDSFMDFLVVNKLISTKQHGFVRRKACVTNLLEMLDLISSKLAASECVDLVFLDFLKPLTQFHIEDY
jgi:hypothetical protein